MKKFNEENIKNLILSERIYNNHECYVLAAELQTGKIIELAIAPEVGYSQTLFKFMPIERKVSKKLLRLCKEFPNDKYLVTKTLLVEKIIRSSMDVDKIVGSIRSMSFHSEDVSSLEFERNNLLCNAKRNYIQIIDDRNDAITIYDEIIPNNPWTLSHAPELAFYSKEDLKQIHLAYLRQEGTKNFENLTKLYSKYLRELPKISSYKTDDWEGISEDIYNYINKIENTLYNKFKAKMMNLTKNK